MEYLSNPYIAGMLSGIATAAVVDFHAFKSWQTWHELASYDWSTAGFRLFQGAITGLLTALGIAGLS